MSSNSDHFRILAVDDEEDILEYYRDVLAGVNESELSTQLFDLLDLAQTDGAEEEKQDEVTFDLQTTTSGEIGYQWVKEAREEGNPFAVAFIDMRMPSGWDGLETAREIRAVDPYVTIIFLTAYMDYSLSDIRSSIGDHFSFLSKPINQEELHQVALTSAKTWHQLREVRRLSKSKDDFLASISHELRTPLTAIIGNAEIILEEMGGDLDFAYRSMMETILKAGKGQLALVNNVLDFSKIQSGRFQIELAEFDLQALADEVQALFSTQAEEAGITFSVTIDHAPGYQLIGDPQRIHQVLINLLGNAFKFTEQGTIELSIQVGEREIAFAVADSGIGISEEAKGRLFNRFEQADSSISRRFGGTGLGLSISQSLAELMEGQLEVESHLGEGSTFTLKLPLQLSQTPTGAAEAGAVQAAEQHFRGRVLIAEDTPELQALLSHMLKRLGVEVVLAENGQVAVEMALQQQMDLILMDMQMPVMNGIEATQMLRSAFYSAPIVALTANVMADHRKQFEAAGTDDFLSKPVDKGALMEVLGRYLKPAEAGAAPVVEAGFSEETLQIFRKELVRNANELRDALYIDNLTTIQSIAHKLKGSGGSFGYDTLSQLGKAVCDAHHEQQYDQVRALSNQLLMLALEISREGDEAEEPEEGDVSNGN